MICWTHNRQNKVWFLPYSHQDVSSGKRWYIYLYSVTDKLTCQMNTMQVFHRSSSCWVYNLPIKLLHWYDYKIWYKLPLINLKSETAGTITLSCPKQLADMLQMVISQGYSISNMINFIFLYLNIYQCKYLNWKWNLAENLYYVSKPHYINPIKISTLNFGL